VTGRRLRTLLQREARATFRDPFTMIALVAVPLAALLVFGFVLSTEVKGLSLGVYDASRGAASRQFVSALAANGTFAIRPYASREALDEALVAGHVSAAVVVPPDFARAVAAEAAAAPAELVVIYDGGETVLAGNAEGFLRALVADAARRVTTRERDAQVAARRARFEATPNPPGVDVRVRALFNPELDATRFMVSGTFGFVLSFLTTLITAISIVKERLDGTFEQLQVTPATSFEILLGKIVPLGVVFTLDVGLMMLAGGFLVGVWPAGNPIFFLAVSAFYVLISLAIGIVISATSATAAEAVQKTVMLSIPLVQISGFAFPLRSMPRPVQWIAEVFPATHYIRISRAIYLRGAGPLAMLPELALLIVFAAALVVFAMRAMERRA
jgi:ABC-2 type transport system permease protein